MLVNGKTVALEKTKSLLEFLEDQKVDITIIAVEHNGEIVPKSRYALVMLQGEDSLEIVRFVGGG